ncbi:MAG: glycosyltransferase [Candidatus Bathyarchaeota archaeon]|nr:glycosyltransferase [Candidatus Bathyarchaeota archaeon]
MSALIFNSEASRRNIGNHFLSVIAPSFTIRRSGDIKKLIDSFVCQTFKGIELILVIEQSKELFHIISNYIEKKGYSNARVIFSESKAGASKARNLGLAQARGDIIAFVDDDVILFSDWAENLLASFEDNEVVAATGQVIPLWAKKGWEWFPQGFDWIFGCSRKNSFESLFEVGSVNGPNASFRRDPLVLVKGYSPNLGAFWLEKAQWQIFGEETELSLRIRSETGKIIVYNSHCKVWHNVQEYKLSWLFIAQRAFEAGRTRKMLLLLSLKEGKKRDRGSTEALILNEVLSEVFITVFTKAFKMPFIVIRQVMASLFILFFVMVGFFLTNTEIPTKFPTS